MSKYTIDSWYDRSIRLWTCLWLDEEENQCGIAQYAVRRAEKDMLIERMKNSDPKGYQV